MIDFIKYSLPVLLNANKNKTYQEKVRRNGKTLMRFLKDNNLILIDPFDENGELIDDLEIKQSQLAEEGLELFVKVVPSWCNYLNRGGNPDNVDILYKALVKIRTEVFNNECV